jgi:hypothetical protein
MSYPAQFKETMKDLQMYLFLNKNASVRCCDYSNSKITTQCCPCIEKYFAAQMHEYSRNYQERFNGIKNALEEIFTVDPQQKKSHEQPEKTPTDIIMNLLY